ncbi:hypothetical protein [Fulvivirga imtechensis]|nr:hypothetical protein [Fulvivirga imtechensis]
MTRMIKAAWGLSLLAGLSVLLYTYAGLPQKVGYELDNFGDVTATVGKEAFFYVSLAVLVIANFSLYTVSRSLRYKRESINNLMTNWQLSLATVLNFFFIIVWNFIMVVNSGETFNYDNFGYLIYISLGLIVVWVLALPILLMKNQISS